ncbi:MULTISPECIES: hypothetical protein [Streptomyces]|jgi:hypothetical protein|uniref:hypothetical protein n=1 Tax=Streptomyces TaxID=1883 RepID=UPI001EFA7F4F|nr:hypothetical protein [Streptomyces sp. CL12-4]MCG8966111.1 hypothetical protein [Streptomyces sp. CL12-4]
MPSSPFVAYCFVVFRFVAFCCVGVLRVASPETGHMRPAKRTGHERRGQNAWNHGAAIREIVWILVDNRGQLGGCEYRRHPYR